MDLLLVSGGTGGHIAPALSVLDRAIEMGVDVDLILGGLKVRMGVNRAKYVYSAGEINLKNFGKIVGGCRLALPVHATSLRVGVWRPHRRFRPVWLMLCPRADFRAAQAQRRRLCGCPALVAVTISRAFCSTCAVIADRIGMNFELEFSFCIGASLGTMHNWKYFPVSNHFWNYFRVVFCVDARHSREHIVNIMQMILGKFIEFAHERLLFGWCNATNTSLDRAYQSAVFRFLRMLSRKCSGSSANRPRKR